MYMAWAEHARLPVYTRIMPSVIGSTLQQRFDISLCRMLDLHRLPVTVASPMSHSQLHMSSGWPLARVF